MFSFEMDEVNITNVINNDYMKRQIRSLLPSIKKIQNDLYKFCYSEKTAIHLFHRLSRTLGGKKAGDIVSLKPIGTINFPNSSPGVGVYLYLIPHWLKSDSPRQGSDGYFDVNNEKGPYIALGLHYEEINNGKTGRVIWDDSYIEVINHEVYHLLQTASLAYKSLSIRYHKSNPSPKEFYEEIINVYLHGSKGGNYDLKGFASKSDLEQVKIGNDYFSSKKEIGAIAGSLLRFFMHDNRFDDNDRQKIVNDWARNVGLDSNWAGFKRRPEYSLEQWAYSLNKYYHSKQLEALDSFIKKEMDLYDKAYEDTKGYESLEAIFRAMVIEYQRFYRR